MVRVWNVTTGQQLERLKGHKDSVYRYVHNDSSPSSMSSPFSDPTPLSSISLSLEKTADTSVAFSPDGKSLVSGSLDRTLRVWDLGATKRAVEHQVPGSKDSVEKGLGTCQSTLNGHKVGLLIFIPASSLSSSFPLHLTESVRASFSRLPPGQGRMVYPLYHSSPLTDVAPSRPALSYFAFIVSSMPHRNPTQSLTHRTTFSQ